MKRVVRWSLALAGLCLLGATVLFPQKVLLSPLLAIYWVSTLFHNTQPPPIAEGVVLSSNPTRFAEVNARWTAALQQKFPAGTSEAVLKSALQQQGFKYDAANQLKYEWGGFACGAVIRVAWTTGHDGAIAGVQGSYYSACL